ncbi:putative ribose-phosphate diphosphokinase [Helianthus anomalus]
MLTFCVFDFRICAENTNEAFAYFWFTDSCSPTVKNIENKAPFEVLSLAGSIAGTLQI